MLNPHPEFVEHAAADRLGRLREDVRRAALLESAGVGRADRGRPAMTPVGRLRAAVLRLRSAR